MKVIACSLRKGNVVDMDGKLYVVLTAENIHPGKGTPVTQLDMRRISDGVKVSERYRTTEQVERAFVEDRDAHLPLRGRRGLPLHEPRDLRPGRGARRTSSATRRPTCRKAWPCMRLDPQRHRRSPSSCRSASTLEIAETEPAMKGQTASSSYKPAILSNGVRTMVPPHIAAGTRVVDHDRGRLLRRARQGLSRPGSRPASRSRRRSLRRLVAALRQPLGPQALLGGEAARPVRPEVLPAERVRDAGRRRGCRPAASPPVATQLRT